MPELPEVETVRRGLEAAISGCRMVAVRVREVRLRQPVEPEALQRLVGARVTAVGRRAKYLLLEMDTGAVLIIHLGMSGTLRLTHPEIELDRHDHVRWRFAGVPDPSHVFHRLPGSGGDRELRYRDPRRFGLVLVLARTELQTHPLFRRLGPEPFDAEFSGQYLWERSRGLRRPVKNLLMDARTVVGIGNIYASEALWRAGIHPARSARRIGLDRWHRLRRVCVEVLGDAIRQGGTTLNDFRDAAGEPGYFAVRLAVYGRAGGACHRAGCDGTIRRIVQAGRSTFYCPRCQR